MSSAAGSPKWSIIDKLELDSYPYLSSGDECLYLLERSRGTWKESRANQIVSNFQRDISLYGDRPDVMRHKTEAIEYFASNIQTLIGSRPRRYPVTLIPMITSKPKSHQWYDDRLGRVARLVEKMRPGEVVVQDILDVTEPMPKAKQGLGSRRPHDIVSLIAVDSEAIAPADTVLLIDDVITTGGHYAACKLAIAPYFPHARIVGVFLARHLFGVEYGLVGLKP